MFRLSNLQKITKNRSRLGRGGSRGGTSGRGHKGQKARTGDHAMRRGFEGGQMPLTRRLPQRGFNNKRFSIDTEIVPLHILDQLFNDGATIDRMVLVENGLINENAPRIKILGGHDLKKKLLIEVDAFSKSAKEAIEKAGGQARIAKSA